MRLYPEKLTAHLQQKLLSVYVVSGEETLLVQECSDQIRLRARESGCTDRELIDETAADFDWQQLHHSAASMSLFAERKLIELRLPSGKPGAEGSKALCEYLEQASGDDVLLIIAGKIDKQSLNSKWYKALDSAGVSIQLWPIKKEELPRWLQQRIGDAGMHIDPDALQLLCDQIEGNLLAAVQEVEKLKLLATDAHITLETVATAVSNNARYNVFHFVDHALKGDAGTSLRMLHGLRAEGSEPLAILGALAPQLRTLYEVQMDCDQGQSANQALSSRRVWQSRMAIMQAALSRHDASSLSRLLEQASRVDGSVKGFASGNPWDNLDILVQELCCA